MSYEINDHEFRRIEREILDPHHRSLNFFNQDPEKGRLGLLAAYDGLFLPPSFASRWGFHPDVVTRQRDKNFEDGLAQGIRWFTPPGCVPSVSPEFTPLSLLDASEFLSHAADYSNLTDYHRLYGAKMVLASVDSVARRVRFSYSTDERGFFAAMGFISSMNHELSRLQRDNSEKEKINPQKPIPYKLVNGLIRLEEPRLLRMHDPEFSMPLPPKMIFDDADLCGFSMKEFSDFWNALLHWSTRCLMIYFRLVAMGRDQQTCMPTQVIAVEEFFSTMAQLSGLASGKVEEITWRLAFDYRTKMPCLFQQPLLIGDGRVAWSPNLILHSRYDRNMLRLMTRTPGVVKNHADNLIGGRERAMLNAFGRRLQRYGWSYKINQQITSGERSSEIDLLGYVNCEPDAVLIVEWKSILTVDEVLEVRTASNELAAAQEQVESQCRILREMCVEEKKKIYPFVPWGRIREYRSMVVTQDVEPDEAIDQSRVPCLSIDSLIAFGRARDSRSPTKISEFARSRPWFDKYRDWKADFDEIRIGDFTYEIPALESPTVTS